MSTPTIPAVLSDVTALYHELRVREGASHRAGGTALYDALGLVILGGCETCGPNTLGLHQTNGSTTGLVVEPLTLDAAMARHFKHVMDEDVAKRFPICQSCGSCTSDHTSICETRKGEPKRDDFDTSHLTGKAKEVAEAIVALVREYVGPTASGGGCLAFRTPEEWKERGELYGLSSILVVVYDGGDLGYFFDYDHENYGAVDAMVKHLKPLGVWSEACTGWYSAVYPA